MRTKDCHPDGATATEGSGREVESLYYEADPSVAARLPQDAGAAHKFGCANFRRSRLRTIENQFTPILLTLLLLLTLTGCDKPTPTTPTKLTITISADTAGWLMPCGCTSNQSGGLLRRATYLANLKKDTNTIYVDAGGAPGGTSAYHREKFEAILTGEKLMSVAAHNLGKSELALGPMYIRDVAQRLSIPFISANTTDTANKPIAPPSIELTTAGRRTLIIGVVSPKFATANIKITDPRQAILTTLGDSKKSDRTIIILAYLPEDELSALATNLPEADAIIGGPTGQSIAPHTIGPVLVAAATNKGKFLIALQSPAASTITGEAVEMNNTYPDAPDQKKNVTDYLARLAQKDFSAADSALVEPLPPGTPANYRIAGTASCTTCHAADQATWNNSRHAHAFETIKAKNFHVDSYCQSCHTTGYGLPGGFDKLSTGGERTNVGCESCHGPSAAHAKEPKKHTPFAAQDQCTRCHDHENSPKFDYATYWPQIAHGRKSP